MQCDWKNSKEGGDSFSPRTVPLRASVKLHGLQLSSRFGNEESELPLAQKSKLLSQYLSKISGLKSKKNLEIVPRSTAVADDVVNKSHFNQLSPRSTSSHRMHTSGLLGSGFFSTTHKKKEKKSPSGSKKPQRKKHSVQQSTNSMSNVQLSANLQSSQRLLSAVASGSELLTSLRQNQTKKLPQNNQTLGELASERKQLIPSTLKWGNTNCKINGGALVPNKAVNKEYFKNLLRGASNLDNAGIQASDEEYYATFDDARSGTRKSGLVIPKHLSLLKGPLSPSQEALFLLNSNMMSPIGMSSPNLSRPIELGNKKVISSPRGGSGEQQFLSARNLAEAGLSISKKKQPSKHGFTMVRPHSSKRCQKQDNTSNSKVYKESQLLASLSEVQLAQMMLHGSANVAPNKENREKTKLLSHNLTVGVDAFSKKGSAKKVRKTLTLCRSGDLKKEFPGRSLTKTGKHGLELERSEHQPQSQLKSTKRGRLLSDDLIPLGRQVHPTPRTVPLYIDTSGAHNISSSPRKSAASRKHPKHSHTGRLDSPQVTTLLEDTNIQTSVGIGSVASKLDQRWLGKHIAGQEVLQSNKNHRSSHSTGSLNAVDDIFRLKEQGLASQTGKLSLLGMKVDRIVREVQKSAKIGKGKDSSRGVPETSNLGQNGSNSKFIVNNSGLQKSSTKTQSQTRLTRNQPLPSDQGQDRAEPAQLAGTIPPISVQKYLQLETYGGKKKNKVIQNALVKGLLSPRVSAPNDVLDHVKSSRKVSPRAPQRSQAVGNRVFTPSRMNGPDNLLPGGELEIYPRRKTDQSTRKHPLPVVKKIEACPINQSVKFTPIMPWNPASSSPLSEIMFGQPKGIDNLLGVGYFAERLNQQLEQESEDFHDRNHLRVSSLPRQDKRSRKAEHKTSRSDIHDLDRLSRLFRLNGPNRSQPKIRSKRASAKDSNSQCKRESEAQETVKKRKQPSSSAVFLPPSNPFPSKSNLHNQRPASSHPFHLQHLPNAANPIHTTALLFPGISSGQGSPKTQNPKHPPAESDADMLWALRHTTLKTKRETVLLPSNDVSQAESDDAGADDSRGCPFAEPDHPNERDCAPSPSFIPRMLSMGGGRPLIVTAPWITSVIIKMQSSLPVPPDAKVLGQSFHLAKLEILRQKRMKRSLPRRKPEVSEVLQLIANQGKASQIERQQESRLHRTSNEGVVAEYSKSMSGVSFDRVMNVTTERKSPEQHQRTSLKSADKSQPLHAKCSSEGYLIQSIGQTKNAGSSNPVIPHDDVLATSEALEIKNSNQRQVLVVDPLASETRTKDDKPSAESDKTVDCTPRSKLWASLAKLKTLGGQNGLPSTYSKPADLDQAG